MLTKSYMEAKECLDLELKELEEYRAQLVSNSMTEEQIEILTGPMTSYIAILLDEMRQYEVEICTGKL